MPALYFTSPVVTDGAWATELQKRGLSHVQCAEEWNLSHPEVVESLAQSYVEAGSKILLTNTFGANRIALEERGLSRKLRKINSEGIRIALRAATNGVRVYASMGPARSWRPNGPVSDSALSVVFKEHADILADSGAH